MRKCLCVLTCAILEVDMKKVALAAALALAASHAFAGSPAAPVVEPEVIAGDSSSSAGGLLVPIMLLVLVAAAVSN